MNDLFFEYVKDKIKDIPCSIYLDLSIMKIETDIFINYMNEKFPLNSMLFFQVNGHLTKNDENNIVNNSDETYYYLINNVIYIKINTVSVKDINFISDLTMYSNLPNSEMSLDINNYIVAYDDVNFNRKQKIEKINKK
jgi:hypothetical protein